jgi:hypothetical protein
VASLKTSVARIVATTLFWLTGATAEQVPNGATIAVDTIRDAHARMPDRPVRTARGATFRVLRRTADGNSS